MKTVVRLVLVMASAFLGAVVWWHCMSAEAKVRRVFAAVAQDVAKDGEMALFTQAMRIKSVSDRVAERCRFRLEGGVELTVTRKEFGELFAYCVRDMKSLHVAFADLRVAVSGRRAEAEGAADFTGSDAVPCLGGPLRRRFSARLEEGSDGAWRFYEVTVRE